MLGREAALLADLPSLKALMSTQHAQTIQDGSEEFWAISGSDFFALTSANGTLFTYSNRGAKLKFKNFGELVRLHRERGVAEG